LSPTVVRKVQRTHSRMLSWPELSHGLDALRLAIAGGSDELIRLRVKQLIPQYLWERSAAEAAWQHPVADAVPVLPAPAFAATAAAHD
jgi:hypothetical protein